MIMALLSFDVLNSGAQPLLRLPGNNGKELNFSRNRLRKIQIFFLYLYQPITLAALGTRQCGRHDFLAAIRVSLLLTQHLVVDTFLSSGGPAILLQASLSKLRSVTVFPTLECSSAAQLNQTQ
ncbi:expressed protein [Phakopsora pachyrhizi]|uniref:Expressed protein n=1 Tax=Phakopsora pachyrhizi TaxID=170000 RepID=A0AAV0B7L8_PHAPC|nr:expressed protein [Phakopsora pachyrhizi]